MVVAAAVAAAVMVNGKKAGHRSGGWSAGEDHRQRCPYLPWPPVKGSGEARRRGRSMQLCHASADWPFCDGSDRRIPFYVYAPYDDFYQNFHDTLGKGLSEHPWRVRRAHDATIVIEKLEDWPDFGQ